MWGKTHSFSLAKFSRALVATSCSLAFMAGSAMAADLDVAPKPEEQEPQLNYPLIEGSFVFEVESDGFISDEGNDEFIDTFNTTEVALDVRFNRIFSLHTDITLEAVDNPARGPRTVGEDIFFEDHGFFFETLHLQADFDNFSFYGGKINPAFGTAWDVTPGIYGVDFAEDYEITERIGFGGSYTLNAGDAGEHTFNAATFFADTSGLSRSFGTNRGRTSVANGGASNTENLESFALGLDGAEIAALPGFSYHLGFRYQSEGQGDFGDDTGVVGGVIQEFEINEDTTLTLNGEIAYFNNFDGGDADNLYGTIGAAVEHGKWFGDAAFSVRDVSSNVGNPDFTDLLFQTGIGREVFENATLEVAYRFLREGNNDNHTVGAVFVYETDFRILRP